MPDPALVLVAEPIAPEAIAWLARECDVRAIENAGDLSALLPNAEGLVVRTYTRVDAALLERAPRLRVVGRAGTALDNIDLEACAERGVAVVHAPDANTQAVVEFVVRCTLDELRPRVVLREAVDDAAWHALRAEACAERQLDEIVFGILGLGRIGRRVARAIAGLGGRVRYHDLLEIPVENRAGAEPVGLPNLLASSHVLSLHTDDRPSNHHFLGGERLSRLSDDAILINTARGLIVDNPALAELLEARPGMRAVLDVHDPEPVSPDDPLLQLDNAMLTPHVAARTEAAMRAMSEVVRDVAAVLDGRAPRHPAPTWSGEPQASGRGIIFRSCKRASAPAGDPRP